MQAEWQKVKYADLPIRIIGSLAIAHFLNHIGREESFFELLTKGFYYSEMLITALTVFLVWTWVRQVTIYLDGKYNWRGQGLMRLLLQLLFGWGGAALIALGLTAIHWHFILDQQFEDSSFFIYEFPIALVFILLINVGYTFFYIWKTTEQKANFFEQQLKEKEQASPIKNVQSKVSYPKTLMVSMGERRIPLPIEDIAYITKSSDYLFIKTTEAQSYLLDQTLDQLMNELNPQQFFRANRQTIIHRSACQAFTPQSYGKLELVLEPKPDAPIIVSQKKAASFKNWLSS